MKFTSNSDLNTFLTQLYRISGMAGELRDYREDMRHNGLTNYISYYTALLECDALGNWQVNFYPPYDIAPSYTINLKVTKEARHGKKEKAKK